MKKPKVVVRRGRRKPRRLRDAGLTITGHSQPVLDHSLSQVYFSLKRTRHRVITLPLGNAQSNFNGQSVTGNVNGLNTTRLELRCILFNKSWSRIWMADLILGFSFFYLLGISVGTLIISLLCNLHVHMWWVQTWRMLFIRRVIKVLWVVFIWRRNMLFCSPDHLSYEKLLWRGEYTPEKSR